MPPKESAAARKAREKAERFAAAQFQERLDTEMEEERARSSAEVLERLGRTEALLRFHEILVLPSARLTVPHTTFEAIRSKMQNEGSVGAQRLLAMQVELRRVEKGAAQLLHELAHLRAEVRGVISGAKRSLDQVNANVNTALNDFVRQLDLAVQYQQNDAEGCEAALNKALLEARRKHAQVALEAQERAQNITELWREATSLHTRIPPRIRRQLQALEKDDLLLMLDTLSFESVVHRYLLHRFAPRGDDPFGDSPATSTSILAAAPTEAEVEAEQRASKIVGF